jgi:hypothetical protein
MKFKLVNEPGLDRELKKQWAHIGCSNAQAWFRIVAKDHLMSLTGPECDESFLLDQEAEAYRFDPIQPMRRSAWKAIERVAIWLESGAPRDLDFSKLSFTEAAQQAQDWAKANQVA